MQKRSTENMMARRFRPLTVMPEEGKLCLAASGGCLSVGAAGWMLGAVVPAVAQLSALLVVGVLYLLLSVPSLLSVMRPQQDDETASGEVAAAAEASTGGARRHRRARAAA